MRRFFASADASGHDNDSTSKHVIFHHALEGMRAVLEGIQSFSDSHGLGDNVAREAVQGHLGTAYPAVSLREAINRAQLVVSDGPLVEQVNNEQEWAESLEDLADKVAHVSQGLTLVSTGHLPALGDVEAPRKSIVHLKSQLDGIMAALAEAGESAAAPHKVSSLRGNRPGSAP